MAKTIQSTGQSSLSPNDFLSRTDARTVGELCSDKEGSIVSPSDLLLDPNLNACLMDACGDLESAALMGGKYTMQDLATLAGSVTAATGKMNRIIRDITMAYLIDRRVDTSITLPAGVMLSMSRSQAWLEQLAQGTRIFGFVETMNAGVLDENILTNQEIEQRDLLVVQADRYFGIRSDRSVGGW